MSRPEGVRIRRADGTVVNCELAPLGVDEDGYDTWEVATALHPGDLLMVDEWPDGAKLVGPTAGWIPSTPLLIPLLLMSDPEPPICLSLRAGITPGEIETFRRQLDGSDKVGPSELLICQLIGAAVGLPFATILWFLAGWRGAAVGLAWGAVGVATVIAFIRQARRG